MSTEEKSKLSGKNGAQVSNTNQMPTLDEEPDQKENEKEKSKEIKASDEKTVPETSEKESQKEDEKPSEDERIEEAAEPRWIETPDGQIEVEDPDDYLIYLEDILKRIHK